MTKKSMKPIPNLLHIRERSAIYVDGIPVDGNFVNDSVIDPTRNDYSKNAQIQDPRALFDKYDADGSNTINFEEFNVLLKDFNFNLSEPKALAYFRQCDKSNKGEISFDEFRLALFTCDPKHPDRTGGFCPTANISPKDLFNMFLGEDEEDLDMNGLLEILSLMGKQSLPLYEVEKIFSAHENPETESIEYDKFRDLWLSLVDVKTELRNRGIKFSKFMLHSTLVKLLKHQIILEEGQEVRTLNEATAALENEAIQNRRCLIVKHAQALAKVTLLDALDAAGQVYVFGSGKCCKLNDCAPRKDSSIEFVDYDVIEALWEERVHPKHVGITDKRSSGQDLTMENQSISQNAENQQLTFSPLNQQLVDYQVNTEIPTVSRPERLLANAKSAFTGRSISSTTSFLWGKRVKSIAYRDSGVVYALTDAGQLFCWGGNKRRWTYVDNDHTKINSTSAYGILGNRLSSMECHSKRLEDSGIEELNIRPLTTRSEILKLSLPCQILEAQTYKNHDQKDILIKPVASVLSTDDQRRQIFIIGQYYNILKQSLKAQLSEADRECIPTDKASNGSVYTDSLHLLKSSDDLPPLTHLMSAVEPEIEINHLILSLKLRGYNPQSHTRTEMISILGQALLLEIECVGPEFHMHMKNLDCTARQLFFDQKARPLEKLVKQTAKIWRDLYNLQSAIEQWKLVDFKSKQKQYNLMKIKTLKNLSIWKRRGREGILGNLAVQDTPNQGAIIQSGAFTHTELNSAKFRESKLSSLSNTYTIMNIQKNNITPRGSSYAFFNSAHALEAIALGSRHALAIHQTGKLLTWGEGTFGRLGLSPGQKHSIAKINDKFMGPYNFQAPDEKELLNKESTGSESSIGRHQDVAMPHFIPSVQHLRFQSIACGFSHNLALTSTGDLYVWGSATHGKLGLGEFNGEGFTLRPTLLCLPANVKVRRISCGASHSACITTTGVLYTWGDGSCGKLGLGDERVVGEDCIPQSGTGHLGVVSTPTLVLQPFLTHTKPLSGVNTYNSAENPSSSKFIEITDVSCGTSHTAVLSSPKSGGCVFIAGSNHAVGKFCPIFEKVNTPYPKDYAVKISCGNGHTALVKRSGELYTWGLNTGGCAGHPCALHIITKPALVTCLYQHPQNLCELDGISVMQSSQNSTCSSEFALPHLAKSTKESVFRFAQTQYEECPFWQIKLPASCCIHQIKVTFFKPENLTHRSTHRTLGTSRSSSRILAKHEQLDFFLILNEKFLDCKERGKLALSKAKQLSFFTKFSIDNTSTLDWEYILPKDTWAATIRIHVDTSTTGFKILTISSVEILGYGSDKHQASPVTNVLCSNDVTFAICRPLSSSEYLRNLYERALRANSAHRTILQQLETYQEFLQEDKKLGRRENCVLCTPMGKCAICILEEELFSASGLSIPKTKSNDKLPQANAVKATIQQDEALENICQKLLSIDRQNKVWFDVGNIQNEHPSFTGAPLSKPPIVLPLQNIIKQSSVEKLAILSSKHSYTTLHHKLRNWSLPTKLKSLVQNKLQRSQNTSTNLGTNE